MVEARLLHKTQLVQKLWFDYITNLHCHRQHCDDNDMAKALAGGPVEGVVRIAWAIPVNDTLIGQRCLLLNIDIGSRIEFDSKLAGG